MRCLIALLPVLFLGACTTLSESECVSGDWFEIGREDGAKGRSSEFILQHAKACNEFGIAPDRARWREGRQLGLKAYCTPRKAYDLGARGRSFANVCPAADQASLQRVNARGRTWHRIGLEIAQTRNEIAAINSELASLPLDDPSRAGLVSQRSFLRLDILTLRARRAQFRF